VEAVNIIMATIEDMFLLESLTFIEIKRRKWGLRQVLLNLQPTSAAENDELSKDKEKNSRS
jgi:hypothetical protein